jgi:hypothetical protein
LEDLKSTVRENIIDDLDERLNEMKQDAVGFTEGEVKRLEAKLRELSEALDAKFKSAVMNHTLLETAVKEKDISYSSTMIKLETLISQN